MANRWATSILAKPLADPVPARPANSLTDPAHPLATLPIDRPANLAKSFTSPSGTVLAQGPAVMTAPQEPRDAHDRLFKFAFGAPEAMAVLLRRMLPAELLAHLDTRSLRPGPTERTSSRLGGRTSDLGFAIDYVEDGARYETLLDDPIADRVTLARVELARAFLHAYENPESLTEARLATLAPLLDVLLDQPEPLASQDLEALCTYVLRAFGPQSPVRRAFETIIRTKRRAREMYATIADSLIAEGRAQGQARAVLDVLAFRNVSIPADLGERVLAMQDEPQLQRWLARALTVSSADEIFGTST